MVIQNLLRNSFYQFQADRAIPDRKRQMIDLVEERDSIHIEEEDSLENNYSLLQQLKSLKKDVQCYGSYRRNPEDANYTMDILTRCVMSKDELLKKTIKILPLQKYGEPVVSVPTSQLRSSLQFTLYF
nr:hypothetical protein [Tanacetum cinerariifolium]